MLPRGPNGLCAIILQTSVDRVLSVRTVQIVLGTGWRPASFGRLGKPQSPPHPLGENFNYPVSGFTCMRMFYVRYIALSIVYVCVFWSVILSWVSEKPRKPRRYTRRGMKMAYGNFGSCVVDALSLSSSSCSGQNLLIENVAGRWSCAKKCSSHWHNSSACTLVFRPGGSE